MLRFMKSRVRWRFLCATSLPLAFAGVTAAQSTLLVGPGGYAEIADAVAAAQAGDLVVVQPGTYLPFNLSRGIRIVAPDGATVTSPPGGGGISTVCNLQTPFGEQASLVGLTFTQNPIYPPAEPSVVVHVLGNVVFADCLFHNWADWGGPSATCNGDVQFDRCEWNCIFDCVSVTGGRVVANDCTMRAYRAYAYGGFEACCIDATAGETRLNFCDLRGSDGGIHGPTGSPAIRLGGSARLSVADSSIHGGASQFWASTAIDNDSIHPVLHARSTILGGHGLQVMTPPVYGPGPAFYGPAQAAQLIGGVAVAAGPRLGAPYSGTVLAPHDGITITVLSFERTVALLVPGVGEPIHFDPATASVYSFGISSWGSPWPDIGGHPWQTVPLPQSLFGEQFWLHALFWDGVTFQVGPTFGGLVY